MRVIAGKYRSRHLKTPSSFKVRPTSDRLRETLFNILGPSVDGVPLRRSLRRHRRHRNRSHQPRRPRSFLYRPRSRLHQPSPPKSRVLANFRGVELITADAERGLDKLASRHLIADFIFLDPPYNDDGCTEVLEYLDASHLVAPQGFVIAEHSAKLDLPERLDRLERTRLLEQGDAALSFYRLAAAA